MKKRWFLVGMIFLLVPWLLVGCGISQEVYDAGVAQLAGIQQELQAVKGELDTAQAKVSELTSSLEKAEKEHMATQAALETTETELEAMQVKVSELTTNLGKAEMELETTQADLEATHEELTEINKVYPPRYFSSSQELRSWLLSNDVSERPPSESAESLYSKALDLQEDALKDGYMVWVDVDSGEEGIWYVGCVTVIDGDIWGWGPEGDVPNNWSDIVDWLKVR